MTLAVQSGGLGGTIFNLFSRELNGIALKDFIVSALNCGNALKSLMVMVSSSVAKFSK